MVREASAAAETPAEASPTPSDSSADEPASEEATPQRDGEMREEDGGLTTVVEGAEVVTPEQPDPEYTLTAEAVAASTVTEEVAPLSDGECTECDGCCAGCSDQEPRWSPPSPLPSATSEGGLDSVGLDSTRAEDGIDLLESSPPTFPFERAELVAAIEAAMPSAAMPSAAMPSAAMPSAATPSLVAVETGFESAATEEEVGAEVEAEVPEREPEVRPCDMQSVLIAGTSVVRHSQVPLR